MLYPNLFYVSYFNFLRICFIKFIVHKMNYEMIKSIMILLTGREKSDMADAGITVSYRLIQTTGEGLIVERERVKYRQTTAGRDFYHLWPIRGHLLSSFAVMLP
jgi:hypothetical protein